MHFDLSNIQINSYEDIKPYLDDLVNREVSSKEETEQWIKDYDVLQAFISEDFAWRYVHQTCDTNNQTHKKAYEMFIQEVSPKLEEVDDVLNKKLIALPGIEALEKSNEAYEVWLRGVRQSLAMFREENIPLNTKIAQLQQQYGDITGDMTIEHEGKTLTMQQAKKYLESPDRAERKIVYEKIRARRKADEEKLNNLLSELIQLRNQVARNAGYESFVEYQWDRRGRFDYTQDDVFSFHRGVKEHVVPIVTKINEQKKAKLGLDRLQPYDVEVDSSGEASLNPFTTGEELLTKATEVVGKVSPAFGKNIDIMKAHGRFDLDSRPGKAPGGYNYPMATSGYPFVFMNAAGTNQDVITFVHEAGHAMHCFCTEEQDIPLAVFRNEYPMEMAEVASMSMELMSMYHRDIFYTDPKDLKRAQQEEIERSIDILPWVSIIDSFQYWLYKNPDHTAEQRGEKFALLLEEYQPDIDWSDYRSYQHIRRQQQGHIFNTPFYYIDYGIAQLGAISVWQNYIQDAPKALEMYQKGLGLGATRKLPALYEATGIPFDFSPARIKELADFVGAEREKLLVD